MFVVEVSVVQERDKIKAKLGDVFSVNIPIQMAAVTDRDGKLTPVWFKYETEEHMIEKIMIEHTDCRDETNYVGIREKRFICTAIIDDIRRVMEIRYNIANQTWRIFQFLA